MLLLGAGCQNQATPTPATAVAPAAEPIQVLETTATAAAQVSPEAPATTENFSPDLISYTYQRPDGNRLVAGQGNLPALQPIDIPLAGTPAWVVAIPWETGSLWAVALTDGRVQGFQVGPNGWQLVALSPAQLPPGSPPVLQLIAGQPDLLYNPAGASLTHPVRLLESGSQAWLDATGQLVIESAGSKNSITLALNALPDARILSDPAGRLLLLTGPSEQYSHAVLGDSSEATSLTLVNTRPEPAIQHVIEIPASQVVEGLAPIWADLDGDQIAEIIVTLSDAVQGAQLAVYDESGNLRASGPAIGNGYRWRHQIAVAPFGPHGELELVDVLTPHIGGVVEFFRLTGDGQLERVASLPGYTSHVIRTRNLDLAAAGDFDGDGRPELLLPDQSLTSLGAIRRTADGAQVAWSLPIEGLIQTNLGAVTLANGQIAVGIGRQDGGRQDGGRQSSVLRIWHP